MPDMGGMGGMGGMGLAIDDRNGTDTIFQESAPASRQQDLRRLRLKVTC
jgi:hypothetical protein